MSKILFPRAGLAVSALVWCALARGAAVPAPERLLPDDTLVVVTAPDFGKLKDVWLHSPQGGFWQDEAMKPFRDKFFSKWQEEVVQPLERELDVSLDGYGSLPQGQVTFALTLSSSAGPGGQIPLGLLLLLDTRDKSDCLRTNLAALRVKWAAAGKSVRAETIRGFEFSVLPLSSNDVPKTLQRLFPPISQVQEPPSDEPEPQAPPRAEWVVGQVGSLLIVGNSIHLVDRIVARLTGDALPCLGEIAAYAADQQAHFRDAPLYGWVNMKALMGYLARKAARHKPQPEDPLVPIDTDKMLAASGLGGVKSIAFALQSASAGSGFGFFVSAPESGRAGLLNILAGESKETAPPPFVPAEVLKYRRWRFDGQKSWASLENMLGQISPASLNGLNFLLDTADMAAKEKDPSFDVRKSLIGNLGDDLISYERPSGPNGGEQNQSSSLYLIGSPEPQQLAGALKSILSILNPQAGPPSEREFLGRKIFSASVPALPLPMAEAASPGVPHNLNWASSSGYVALSTDATTLEEYLRSSASQAKTLRETPGLVEAMSRVIGPGTCFSAYDNQAETMRATFAALKKDPNSSRASELNPLSTVMGFAGHALDLRELMDFSLLPPFDRVAKYFSFTVSAGSASVEGLSYQTYFPVPPRLRLDIVAGLTPGAPSLSPEPGLTNSVPKH